MSLIKIKKALLSVYDKTGIIDFAKELIKRGVEIISTGGTYATLIDNGIKCIKIEDFTGQKEILGGRVKTLHTKIHSGILSKRDKESDELNIETIDLVVVNLYPFEKLVESNEKDIPKLIEMIDIGGPTMLRAAAKNYKYVVSVCDPTFYSKIIEEMDNGGVTEETRLKFALNVFKTTSYYDSLIYKTLFENTQNEKYEENLGTNFTVPFKKEIELRYGENPHQKAYFASLTGYSDKSLKDFYINGKIQGKELSYNNISDISAAINILRDLEENSTVVIKHNNPCGAASKGDIYNSFMASYEGDPVSIFGGIVGFKGTVDKNTASILEKIFLEIIIAESFTHEALEILKQKKNLRLLEYKKWKDIIFSQNDFYEVKKVLGSFLFQEKDKINPYNEEFKVVTKLQPTEKQIEDMKFGQAIVKHVKSNAIVVVKDKMLLGVGAGQMNRVTSAKIALDWAKDKAKDAILASDAFFPMDDTVRLAAERGIKAIIQPGGSIKDGDSINACDELGITMVFTGIRHFLH